MSTVAIVQLQKKQEAKFVCSACGADRGCDCNAPAVEKLAEIREKGRQRSNRSYDKKRQQKQQTSDVRKAGGWSEKALDQALSGKKYQTQRVAYENSDYDDESDPDPQANEKAVVIYAGSAIDLAVKLKEIISRPNVLTDEGRDYIRRAAEAWHKLSCSL